MAEPVQTPQPVILDTTPDPVIYIEEPEAQIDIATVSGMAASVLLIILAIWEGGSAGNFFNIPAIFIVVFGTLAVTAISYATDELKHAWSSIEGAVVRRQPKPDVMATQIIDLSIIARKRGILSLTNYDRELAKEPFLKQAVQLVSDGFLPPDIERFLQQDIESDLERQKKSSTVLRRASEVAPGMGLIGTLVGLVQMLAQLNDPSSIGPAMAIALLTTFYGAIMGTMVLAPLAAKIERNGVADALQKTLIMAGAGSIARQENPRRLEIILNSILPAASRIKYFD